MKDWKTSLAGILVGFVMTVGPIVQARLGGDKTAPPVTASTVLQGLGVAALGVLAGDSRKPQ